MSNNKVSSGGLEITNFYSHVKRNEKEDALRDYRNKHLINIDLPARILLLGPSGSGKSNLVLQLIKSINKFDKIVLIAKCLDEPLYVHLIDTFRRIEKETKSRILLASSSLADIPALEDFNPNENNLLIVDDFICDSAKELKPVEECWVRGRKRGVTMMFLSQSYFATPKKIRQNSNYIIIKRLYNIPDLKRILKEYSISAGVDEIKKMYEAAVAGGFTNFFMIDSTTNVEALKFRKNFAPFN
jgi:DNA helicase HerA-like ATPase